MSWWANLGSNFRPKESVARRGKAQCPPSRSPCLRSKDHPGGRRGAQIFQGIEKKTHWLWNNFVQLKMIQDDVVQEFKMYLMWLHIFIILCSQPVKATPPCSWPWKRFDTPGSHKTPRLQSGQETPMKGCGNEATHLFLKEGFLCLCLGYSILVRQQHVEISSGGAALRELIILKSILLRSTGSWDGLQQHNNQHKNDAIQARCAKGQNHEV